MKVVLVGFKSQEENSVSYKKITITGEPDILDTQLDSQKLGEALVQAYERGAEFVSVRFIPPKEEI